MDNTNFSDKFNRARFFDNQTSSNQDKRHLEVIQYLIISLSFDSNGNR